MRRCCFVDRFKRLARQFLGLVIISVLMFRTASSRGTPIVIQPVTGIDERLFLTYVLHDLYAQYPTDWSDASQVEQSLGSLRLRSNGYLEFVKRRGFDPDLTNSYADLITSIDDYTNFLASIGEIQQAAADHVKEGHDQATAAAAFSGVSASVSYSDTGASDSDSALAGLAVGAVSWIVDNEIKQHDADRAKQQAMKEAAQQLKNQLADIQSRLSVAELSMASRYSWSKFEVRSTETEEDEVAWKTAFDADDVNAMLAVLDRKIALRPRDPMLLAVRQLAASCDTAASAAEMRDLAAKCFAACSLVPPDSFFDSYRSAIAMMAADIANRAFSKELNGKALGKAHSTIAAYAVDLWDTVLSLEPSDPTGESRERRAWALMASGHLSDAVREANEVADLRGNTMRAALNMARLMDAAGDIDDSFKWLQHAVNDLHYNDITWLKQDPDLAAMRTAKAQEFAALINVSTSWQINYGFFNDDITLTNNSTFPITNVVLSCDLRSGSSRSTPTLNTTVIQPGQTYTWTNCVSIPGSHTDTATATLSCDQNR